MHLPAEFEIVVKDLWELRVQLLTDRLEKNARAEVLHSSQQQNETEEGTGQRRHKNWDVKGKKTPTMLESLGLCYMAVVILHLPISLGDLHRYETYLSHL